MAQIFQGNLGLIALTGAGNVGSFYKVFRPVGEIGLRFAAIFPNC